VKPFVFEFHTGIGAPIHASGSSSGFRDAHAPRAGADLACLEEFPAGHNGIHDRGTCPLIQATFTGWLSGSPSMVEGWASQAP
jgi:hypothetical protein